MKIRTISVEGYKSLKKISMKNLGNLAVLIGENSCGKSNILESIHLFISQFEWKQNQTSLNDNHWFRKDVSSDIEFIFFIDFNPSEIKEIFGERLTPLVIKHLEKEKKKPILSVARFVNNGGMWTTAIINLLDVQIVENNQAVNYVNLLQRIIPNFSDLEMILLEESNSDKIYAWDRKGKQIFTLDPNMIPWQDFTVIKTSTIQEFANSQGAQISNQPFNFGNLGYSTLEQILDTIRNIIRRKMKVAPPLSFHPVSYARQSALPSEMINDLIQLYQSGKISDIDLWHDIHDRFGQSIPGEIRPVQGTLFFEEQRRRYPIQNVGGGYQTRLQLIWHLFKTKDSVILIEEPEAHLHPRLMHDIISLIRGITDTNQVIMTTHSTTFLDQCDYNEIWFAYKTQGATKAKQVEGINNLREIALELGVRPSDVLMSNNILFVEGPSDVIAFRAMGRLLGVNLNQPRVNVIPMKGVGKEKYHLGVWTEAANVVGVPMFVLLDGDPPAKLAAKNLTTGKRGKPAIDKSRVYTLKKPNIEDYYPKKMLAESISKILNLSETESRSLKRAIKGKDRVKIIKAWLAKHNKDPDRIWKVAAAEYIKEHMELKDLNEDLKDLLHRIDDIFKH